MTREETIKIISDNIKNNTINTIAQQESVTAFKEFKKASQKFLTTINQQTQIYNHNENLENALENAKDTINFVYRNMRESSEYTRKMLQAQHTYEQALNKLLGRKIYLTYVTNDGNLLFADDVNIGEIYNTATGNKGRGNIASSAFKDLKENIDEDLNKINQRLQKSALKRQKVYTTAIERWIKSGTDKIFWWDYENPDNQYKSSVISSKGVIAEGYAGAVINEDPQINNSKIEQSLYFLNKNHIKKDSIPATLKGDIVLDSNMNIQQAIKRGKIQLSVNEGGIQFAVKEGQFSTSKIGQYINLANNVIKMSDNTLKEDFILGLPKLINSTKISEKIINIINSKANDKVESILKETLKGKKKNYKTAAEVINLNLGL